MTTIFLIRHGLTEHTGRRLYGRTPGISLDERGRAQAERLAERFASVPLAAVYSSPLERCIETVRPLAASKAIEVVPREGLIEMDAGAWTARPLAQLRRMKAWRMVFEAPSSFRFPGGEAFAEANERALSEVLRIAAAHPRGRVAVGSHGDVIRMLLAHFAGAHLDHFQRTIADPASVSVVQLSSGSPRVLLVNDTGGLERFAPPRGRTGSRGRAGGRGNLRG
jgi:probable phosphoglycerate mutase